MTIWLISILISGPQFEGEWILVTSNQTTLTKLSQYQIKQIYLGKLDRIDGIPVRPVQLRKKDPVRQAFEAWLFPNGFDLDNYWLTQGIDSGAPHPINAGSWALAVVMVERNPGFIAYIPQVSEEELERNHLHILIIE